MTIFSSFINLLQIEPTIGLYYKDFDFVVATAVLGQTCQNFFNQMDASKLSFV